MKKIIAPLTLLGSLTLASTSVMALDEGSITKLPGNCEAINAAANDAAKIEGATLHAKLANAIEDTPGLAGFKLNMWATIVDNNGVVCAVANTDPSSNNAQWLGSRVISAQKANTANAFSLTNGLALSTANLWAATQPGGSLFGLQFSNPVNPAVAYGGADLYGTATDPLVGAFIGGVNVFGGGLALYDKDNNLLGAIGMSGDSSCADHIKAWAARDALGGLDNVKAGVANGTDNIIFDITGSHNNFASKSGFGHQTCGLGEEAISANLPVDYPYGD